MIEPTPLDAGLSLKPSPQFGGEPVAVQTEHCLNARYKQAGCRRCADACPTAAITLKPHEGSPYGPALPHLDPEQCVCCGLCLHACPTDVFTQPAAIEIKLAQTVANLPQIPVSLVCPQHPNPTTTVAPVAASMRHQRCLAALSLSQLLELSDNGQRSLWLDDTPCAECPLGRAQPIIAQTATSANHLLQAFGHAAVIHTQLSQPDQLNPEPRQLPLFEGDQPKLTRRGLLGTLGQMTRQAADRAAAASAPKPLTRGRTPVCERLPHHLPDSRRRLCQQLDHLGRPVEEALDTTGLPLTQVIIEAQACSACRLCARFCPTGALHFVADAENFGLSFKPALCLDCGICAIACPENAVSFGSQLTAADLIADKACWLVVGTLTACARCGEPTAVRGEESAGQPLCYSCQQSGGPTTSLKDSAGLMADLLKHLPKEKPGD